MKDEQHIDPQDTRALLAYARRAERRRAEAYVWAWSCYAPTNPTLWLQWMRNLAVDDATLLRGLAMFGVAFREVGGALRADVGPHLLARPDWPTVRARIDVVWPGEFRRALDEAEAWAAIEREHREALAALPAPNSAPPARPQVEEVIEALEDLVVDDGFDSAKVSPR